MPAAALDASARRVSSLLNEADDARLAARVPSFEDPAVSIAGWRLLMMMAEHDIHHRSQIMTYAGINRWPVQQVFGRTYEEVLRRTRAGHATSGDGSPRDGGSS